MTKYRTISNGHWDYLQYEVEYKYLFFWTRKRWEYVWKPYCDKATGTYYSGEYNSYISSLKDGNLEEFVQKWPNIEEYFEQAKLRQAELVKIYHEYRKKLEEKKNKITYL